MPDRMRMENRAINAGLGINVLLAALKTSFGIFGHSGALLADGINSTSDVVYCLVVKIFMIFARKPSDPEHPYGHRQLESIAALAVGCFVVTTAVALFWNAVNQVYDIMVAGETTGTVSLAAMWVGILTVVTKIGLTVYTRRAAIRTGNGAVLALARDHRNDVFSASGAVIGILISRCGWAWGDPLVGAGVAIVVLVTGLQILRESSAELMDTVPGEMLEREARDLLRSVAGITAVEEIQAHRFGPYFVLNVTLGVEGSLSVRDGDRIASETERALCDGMAYVMRVYVHVHPARVSHAG